MDIIAQKGNLRKEISILKKGLTNQNRQTESHFVISEIELDVDFLAASVVFAYWPLADEIDLRPMLKKWGESKKILLPKIVGKQLVLIEYKGDNSLKPEPYFGILEPQGVPFLKYEAIDYAIVPGIAFDDQGCRLGRGGSYYDRLLPNLKNAKKIGVSFSFQRVLRVPCEPHDIMLDQIIFGA